MSHATPPAGPSDKQAYDELPDGVLVADETGSVVALNTAGARILGRSPDEVVGLPLGEAMRLIDPQGRDWWGCTRPYDGLTTRTRQPERRLTVQLPGGEEQDLFVSVRYVREDGRVVRVVVAFRDTAARDRLERSGSELVSTVAHELRSPLTSVKGFTATLLAKWDRFTDEQKKLMLQTVNADADRVTRLISELLDVSRIESGRLELRRQVVDVPAAVEKAIAGRVAAGEPRERFRVAVTGGLPEMWLDPDKLDQVIGNLVENALRHGAGTVTVTVGPRDDGVEVQVTDEGPGIAPEATTRIFNKFWRGSRRGGTGLGLYIARGIVEAHGGSIDAGQAPGGGALFRVVLPAGTPSFAR